MGFTVLCLTQAMVYVGLVAATAFAYAETYSRFVESVNLPDGRVATVAEGDFEPRSVGSFSVKLYSAANPDFPFDDFQAGIVAPRNGFVEDLDVRDVDHDGNDDLVVVIRSAGTGGYLSGYAFRLADYTVSVVASVDGLEPSASVVEALETTAATQPQ